jgi:DNA-binding NtrC family response regulator
MQNDIKKIVLVVESGYWDSRAFVHHIREIGAWPVHVETVEEAIEKLKQQASFSGIISDVRQNHANGLQLVEWVNEHYPEHPPILLHSLEEYLGAIDLKIFNLHNSDKIRFARKAFVMRGDTESDYQYITEFVESL